MARKIKAKISLGKKRRIGINLENDRVKETVEIDAYEIDAKHLLFAHRFYATKKGETDSHPWRVSHGPTGRNTGGKYRTLKDAIDAGLRLLSIPGVDWNFTDMATAQTIDRESIRSIIFDDKYTRPIKRKQYVKPKPTCPEGFVKTNDIKASEEIYTDGGAVIWAADNKKGIIRRIRDKGPDGDWVTGDSYIFSWKAVCRDGQAVPIWFTPDQLKKKAKIQTAGISC
jgi:hypothetical protein